MIKLRQLLLLIAVLPSSSFALSVYEFSGPNYNVAQGSYTTNMKLSGSFTTNTPLPPDMPLTSIADRVVSWSFSDGLNTYTPLNSVLLGDDPDYLQVETDSSGNVVSYIISFVSPKPQHALGSVVDGFFLAKYFEYPNGLIEALNDGACDSLNNNTCLTILPSTDYEVSLNYDGVWTVRTPTPPPNPIPTLSEISTILLIVMLLAVSLMYSVKLGVKNDGGSYDE